MHEHTPDVSLHQRPARPDFFLVGVAFTAVVVLVWMMPMGSSLWLDESLTAWVVSDGIAQVTTRAWDFQGQSPLYYAVVWLTTAALGESEIALRLPSLFAMIVSGALLYRLAHRFAGASAALIALAIFVSLPETAFHASDARPYGVAVLAVLISTTALERWLRTQTVSAAVLYGIAAALVFWTHYVSALVLLAHLVYFIRIIDRDSESAEDRIRPIRQAIFAGAVSLALVSPSVVQLSALFGRRDELVFTDPPTILDLLSVWALPVSAIALLTVSFAGPRTRAEPPQPQLVGSSAWLLFGGFIIPPLALAVLAFTTGISLWTPRYWVGALPFGAVLFGAAIAPRLRGPRMLTGTTIAILVLGIAAGADIDHFSEDWRAATETASLLATSPEIPVLVFTNLVELRDPEVFDDPAAQEYLLAPLQYYPVSGMARALPAPGSPPQFRRTIVPILAESADADRVVVVANQRDGEIITSMTAGWFLGNGFEIDAFRTHGDVHVTMYQRVTLTSG